MVSAAEAAVKTRQVVELTVISRLPDLARTQETQERRLAAALALSGVTCDPQGVGKAASFLIAEDDELVGRVLVRTLSEHGRTELVRTVEDARSALKTRSFTAVVVDVGLPDGSGLDLISDARSQDPSIAALVVSGGVDERRLAEAHHLGAHYLLKPVDTRQIGLFAVRMRSKLNHRDAKIAAIIEQWSVEYDLTPAEAGVLALAVQGAARSRLAELRGVAASTVKKQVQVILTKTGDTSLEAAVSRLLRAIVDEG